MESIKPLFDQRTTRKLAWSIVILGIVLRVFKMFHMKNLDQDEGITYDIVTNHSFLNQILRENFEYHTEPFFTHIFHKLWLSIIDLDFYTLRFPSLLFAIGSIFILWKILECIFDRCPFVLLSTLLYFSTSNFFIYYGILFRTYSMGIFLCLAVIAKYIYLHQAEVEGERPSTFQYSSFAVLIAISIYSSYSSLWVIAGMVIFIFISSTYKSRSSRYIILGTMLSFPWLIFSTIKHLPTILKLKADSMFVDFADVDQFGLMFARFSDLIFLAQVSHLFLLLIIPFFILSQYGLWKLFKLKPFSGLLVFSTILVAYGSTILFSLFVSPVFDYKNLWFPNICLIICFFFALRQMPLGNKYFLFFSLNTILLLPVPFTLKYYQTDIVNYYQTSKSKDVFEYLNAKHPEGPLLLLIPSSYWSETVRVYKSWHSQNPFLKLRFIEEPVSPSIGLKEPVYYFDLENSYEQKNIEEVSDKIKCQFEDVSHSIEGVILKKCQRADV